MTPQLDASQQAIDAAEKALGIRLPDGLKAIWLVCNGLDYPQDWRIYPVFDKAMPKKCWGHIVEENKRTSSDYIQEDLLKIAGDSYGNRLVLMVVDGVAGEDIYSWNHETTGLRRSPITFAKIQAKARQRVDGVMRKIARSEKKRR